MDMMVLRWRKNVSGDSFGIVMVEISSFNFAVKKYP